MMFEANTSVPNRSRTQIQIQQSLNAIVENVSDIKECQKEMDQMYQTYAKKHTKRCSRAWIAIKDFWGKPTNLNPVLLFYEQQETIGKFEKNLENVLKLYSTELEHAEQRVDNALSEQIVNSDTQEKERLHEKLTTYEHRYNRGKAELEKTDVMINSEKYARVLKHTKKLERRIKKVKEELKENELSELAHNLEGYTTKENITSTLVSGTRALLSLTKQYNTQLDNILSSRQGVLNYLESDREQKKGDETCCDHIPSFGEYTQALSEKIKEIKNEIQIIVNADYTTQGPMTTELTVYGDV